MEGFTYLHDTMSSARVMLGDLNVVLHSFEKVNVTGTPCQVGTELSDVLNRTSHHDHKYVGEQFAWDNGSTFCKLDMILVNGVFGNTIILKAWLIFSLRECLIMLWTL